MVRTFLFDMNIEIRLLREADLPEADRIFRLAFGTFLGLPDPMAFAGDADYVRTRWRASPEAALGAYVDDVLVGSNFAARWGSFGFFGPLTVHPDFWDKGIARRLLATTMSLFERWGTRHTALFTFPHSAKHVGLYQAFGFWPQQLTPVMAKQVEASTSGPWTAYSEIPAESRAEFLAASRMLTDAIYPGLDVTGEIEATAGQGLGDTVLLHDSGKLVAFAVVHVGQGSEAGSGAAYIKFGAALPGPEASGRFDRLLSACESLARARDVKRLTAGVNTMRHDAYRKMLARGFRTMLQGVAMQQGNALGYNRADCYVIDDWR